MDTEGVGVASVQRKPVAFHDQFGGTGLVPVAEDSRTGEVAGTPYPSGPVLGDRESVSFLNDHGSHQALNLDTFGFVAGTQISLPKFAFFIFAPAPKGAIRKHREAG